MHQLALLSSFLSLFLLASEPPKNLQKPQRKLINGRAFRVRPQPPVRAATPAEEAIEGEIKYAYPIMMPTLALAIKSALRENNLAQVQVCITAAKDLNDIKALLGAHSIPCPSSASEEKKAVYELINKAIVELLADPKNRAKLGNEHLHRLEHLVAHYEDVELIKAVLSCDHLKLGQFGSQAFHNISMAIPPYQLVRFIHPDTVNVLANVELVQPLYFLEYMFSVSVLSDSEASAKICTFVLQKLDANGFYMIPGNQDQFVKILFKLPNLFHDVYRAVIKNGKSDHLKKLLQSLKPVMANWITQCTSFLKMGGNMDILEVFREQLIASLDLPTILPPGKPLRKENCVLAPRGHVVRRPVASLHETDPKYSLRLAIKEADSAAVKRLLAPFMADKDIIMILDTLISIAYKATDPECTKAVVEAAVQLLADPTICKSVPNTFTTAQIIIRYKNYPALVQSLLACEHLDISELVFMNLPVLCELLSPHQMARRVKPTKEVLASLHFKNVPMYALEYAYLSRMSSRKWTKFLIELTNKLSPINFYPIQKELAKLLFRQQAHYKKIHEAVMANSTSNPVKEFFTFMAEAMEKAEIKGFQLYMHHGNGDIYHRIVDTFIETLEFPTGKKTQEVEKKKKKSLLTRQHCIRPARKLAPKSETQVTSNASEVSTEATPADMNALLFLLSIMKGNPDHFQMN